MASNTVRAFKEKIRKTIIRLPRNLQVNRWYVNIGNTVYLHSPTLSSRLVQDFKDGDIVRIDNAVRVFTPLHCPLGLTARASKLESAAMAVPHLGRFGNAVRDFTRAIAVSERLGVPNLCLLGKSIFTKGGDFPVTRNQTASGGMRFWFNPSPRNVPIFSHVILWSSGHFVLPQGNYFESWEMAREVLQLSCPKVGGNPVIVHLRGGDVFGTRDVKNYGQPPLSYYEKVLDHCQATSVHVVYQDKLNPVLDGLIRLCKERSLHCTTQSGSLLEDIRTLMGAHTLVAGRGTFLPAIVGLSPHVKRVYFFEDKFSLQPPRSGFEIYRVVDTTGDYRSAVLSGNWENRPDQRALMTSYPVSHLKLERVP